MSSNYRFQVVSEGFRGGLSSTPMDVGIIGGPRPNWDDIDVIPQGVDEKKNE